MLTTRLARATALVALATYGVLSTWAGYQWDPLGMIGPPGSTYAVPLVSVIVIVYSMGPLLALWLVSGVMATAGRWVWFGTTLAASGQQMAPYASPEPQASTAPPPPPEDPA